MNFHLIYKGPLKSRGSIKEIHEIRKFFHPQLVQLWNQSPLKSHHDDYKNEHSEKGKISIVEKVNNHSFIPLITKHLMLYCNLDILFLRTGEPGCNFQGGDLDNRLKTLFDALRCPQTVNEIPNDGLNDNIDNPLYCLLQDDSLIYSVNINTDRLLISKDPQEVLLIINVHLKATEVIWANLSIIG